MFRANVNATNKTMTKNTKKLMNDHVWGATEQEGKEKKGKPRVKWDTMTRPKSEGGQKMIDPECMIDAGKIKVIKTLMTKDRQPWMKWVERKMQRKRKEWGVYGNVLGGSTDE